MAVDAKFIEKVRRKLLARGFVGITKQKLLQQVRTPYHPAADLNELLAIWRKRRWIDEYREGNGITAKHIIRATQLFFTEWPKVNNAMHALMYDPSLDLSVEQDQSEPKSDDPEEKSHLSEV
jgi:hypothetical protein